MPGPGVKNADEPSGELGALGDLHLAPAQIAAASAIARPDRWQSLAEGSGSLWGKIRGNAVYEVACALSPTAFRCSCPAFAGGRRPCKHALALLLLYSRSPES